MLLKHRSLALSGMAIAVSSVVLAGSAGASSPQTAAKPKPPIRIGSTLAITGPLAPTANIHKVAGEQFVKWLNANGGLLGRKVQWVVRDDESSPEKSAALYERLISEDKVDLIVGPYGTPNISAAMQVAKRHDMVFVHNSGTLVYSYTYAKQFPLYASGIEASKTGAKMVFDAYASAPNPPATVAFVTSKFAATNYLVYGHGNTPGALQIAKDRGLKVVLELQYDVGNSDWSSIAQRVKDANPDLLFMGATAADGVGLLAALNQLKWQPRHHFYQFPAPGPMLGAGKIADGATSVTMFEPYMPYLKNTGANDLVAAFPPAALAAGIKYIVPDIQAALMWSEWQTIVAGVKICKCLDQNKIAKALHSTTIRTVIGNIKFDPKQHNYYGDLGVIKQIQDGKWVVVYPPAKASEGRRIR